MCTPPLCTPPGHQETLRVSRALVRIARNETRKATSTTNAAPPPGRSRPPNGSTLTIAPMAAPAMLIEPSLSQRS